MDWSLLVQEVKPLLPPAFNRLLHREAEILRFLENDKANSAHNVGVLVTIVAFDEEYLLPLAPVGIDAQKTLAYGDKNGEMQNGIWCQLPELNAVGEGKET
jgi:hypothetical protein